MPPLPSTQGIFAGWQHAAGPPGQGSSRDRRTFRFVKVPTRFTDTNYNGRTSSPRRLSQVLQSLDIQSFSYEDRHGVLPGLVTLINDCGGWILHRRSLSTTSVEFQLEIQLRSVVNLYGSIAGSGIELTRSGHAALASLCISRRNSDTFTELGQVVSIRLEISFLDDEDLPSVLASGMGLA